MIDKRRIGFLLMVHNPYDGLLYHHIALALARDYTCSVFSAFPESDHYEHTAGAVAVKSINGATMSREQIRAEASEWLCSFSPDLVICDTPLAVVTARKAGYKAVYYFSEWYPSKKNLRSLPAWRRPFRALFLWLAFIYAALKTDAFISGEYYKTRYINRLFPYKQHLYLPYYPSIEYMPEPVGHKQGEPWCLLYAGPLTDEKGWGRVLSLVTELACRNPKESFVLRVLSHDKPSMKVTMPNLSFDVTDELPFEDFCRLVGEADVCLDLRDNDYENTRCMPVKLFYYMAAGKPCVYTDLRAIRKELPEADSFACIVKPNDTIAAVSFIERCISNEEYYAALSVAARNMFASCYNWQCISNHLLSWIKTII